MTLIMTMNIGSSLTVMTSDERIAYTIDEHLIPTEEKVNKAHVLNNNVLFGWGGDYDLAMEAIKELKNVVTSTDTLETCIEHLKKITDRTETTRRSLLLLSGFYANGTTGMAMKRTGEAISELKVNEHEYRYIMFPPTGDYSDRQDEFFYVEDFTPNNIAENIRELGIEHWKMKSINTAVNHLVKLHGVISHKEPKAVTAEGHYNIIYKDEEGTMKVATGEFDTSEIHAMLDEQEKHS